MDLPFKTAPQPETHIVGTPQSGTLELPKLYSVTPNEEIQIAENLRRAGSGRDVQALNTCKCEIAAIAFSRIFVPTDDQPVAPTADDMAELPLALVDGLFDYLLSERREWKEPDPTEGSDPNSTGASTSNPSAGLSPTTTTASAPAGPTATPAKTSAKSRSKKSEPATKPTSNSEP